MRATILCTLPPDRPPSNNLLKDRKLLRVDLQHVKSYNKQLAAALEAAPADYLPLVRIE